MRGLSIAKGQIVDDDAQVLAATADDAIVQITLHDR